jgi:pyruvate carboxylase subunit B
MKYFVTLGARTIEVDVDGDQLRVDGVVHTAHLESVPGTPEQRVVIDGVATSLAVDHFAGGSWRLVDQGAVRDVAIEDARSRHIRSLVAASAGAAPTGALKAPMPGMVIRIDVAVGQRVEVGASLVVLEAMKMENELRATVAGVVTAVRVEVGAAVEKGVVLLDIGLESVETG